jgi:hypothetical protein
MPASEAAAIICVVLTLGTATTLIIRMLLDHLRRSRSEKLQAELYSKLLDKFGSSSELLAYLQTEAGQNLLKSAPAERAAPHNRILNSFQAGIFLSAVASALLALRGAVSGDAAEPLLILGSLGLAAGLGLAVSGGVAWLLSRHWGLLNGQPGGAR